ncbi:MAG: RsmE family RNA methyltransferase [Proteobacteria bacterium]|nr:RsmE family RNA methyltransferase [Pseudomonadota bacterium]
MAHLFRFLGHKVPAPEAVLSRTWEVSPSELEHVRKVLKLKVCDRVELMNGEGAVAEGAISEITSHSMEISAEIEWMFACPKINVALAIGALKPADFDETLPSLIELGIGEIHVFQQEDTAGFRTSEKAQDRWKRIILSAAKQSKSAWLPTLYTHGTLSAALKALQSFETKIVLDVSGDSNFLEYLSAPAKSLVVLIGGERGLSSGELNLCEEAHYHRAKMGGLVLRAKTAAQAAAALVSVVTFTPNEPLVTKF